MEFQHRVKTLVVLTLLQLCRAEIKDSNPQWYSANIINDVFQPKSISELFTTEQPPFSTANPIIVSSSSLADDVRMLSTLAPPTSLSSTTETGFSTTTTPFLTSSQSITSLQQQFIPEINNDQIRFAQVQPSGNTQQAMPIDYESLTPLQPLLKLVSGLQTQPQRNVQIQEQSTTAQAIPSPEVTASTFFQPPVTETTQSQEAQFAFSQDPQTSFGPSSSTSQQPQNIPQQPNYFLIYQQAPQSIQNYPNPSSSPRTTAGGGLSTTASTVTSTFPTTFSSTPTFSTMRTVPITMRTSPVFSTTSSPITQQPTVAVTVTPSSTVGSSSISTTSSTRPVTCVPQSTPISRVPLDGIFPLKIRVIAPSGSITNVNFNARTQAPLTTQRTIRTTTTLRPTTTRRPTTRRTAKPRKNTYERCLQGCRKNGQNLCAAPLSQSPVDPSTLRGFPSVCHMACHNSYRKTPYEKIVDGSCSRLRTRIRPVDSDSKLKRDELNKVQYFLDNSGQPAIVEFSGAYA